MLWASDALDHRHPSRIGRFRGAQHEKLARDVRSRKRPNVSSTSTPNFLCCTPRLFQPGPPAANAFRLLSGSSNIHIIGSSSVDVVVLDSSLNGFTVIFQVEGNNGADKLDASRVNFAVAFDGGAGNGKDILSVEDGIDTLAGDADTDFLFGGLALDIFTAPGIGEKNEDGIFNDRVFFTNLEALLSVCP